MALQNLKSAVLSEQDCECASLGYFWGSFCPTGQCTPALYKHLVTKWLLLQRATAISCLFCRRFFAQVLLVSSSRHPDQWIVPGGGMEPEEEPCGAAVREVFEEVSRWRGG